MDNTDSVGASRLRAWLAAQGGYAQQELAKDLKVSAGMVSHLVTGRARPSMPLAHLLEARTRGAVSVSDWLAPDEAAEISTMSRLVGRADG